MTGFTEWDRYSAKSYSSDDFGENDFESGLSYTNNGGRIGGNRIMGRVTNRNTKESSQKNYQNKIISNRPAGYFNFSFTLNKIDEVDESRLKSPDEENEKGTETKNNDNEKEYIEKDENGNPAQPKHDANSVAHPSSPHVMWKDVEAEIIHISDEGKKVKQRPKSASCISSKPLLEHNIKKRPNSSCETFHPNDKKTFKPSKIPRPYSSCEYKKSCSLSNIRSRSDFVILGERYTKSLTNLNVNDYESMKTGQSKASSGERKKVKRRPSSAGANLDKKRMQDRYMEQRYSWDDISSDDYDSLLGLETAIKTKAERYPARPSSACGIRTPDFTYGDFSPNRKAEWISGEMESTVKRRKSYTRPSSAQETRRESRSSLKCTTPEPCERNYSLQRFTRCLKLLGLQPEDFGIYDRQDVDQLRRRSWEAERLKHVEPTFVTRLVKRSVSLDCLKEAVREAVMEQSFLDLSQREILAKAVYEEWYFKKTEEAQKLKEEAKRKKKEIEEQREKEFLARKAKAEENFQRWIENKKKQIKKEKLKETRINKAIYGSTQKTKEEAEKAYEDWKKVKEKEIQKKTEVTLQKKESQIQEEKQKEEKKVQADKAFQEWKRKADASMKAQAVEKQEKEKKETYLKTQLNEEKQGNSSTSYKAWKSIKDEEIKRKLHSARLATQKNNSNKSVQLAERLYEAEQAFEEWLDKVEARRYKQMKSIMRSREKSFNKPPPWAPN